MNVWEDNWDDDAKEDDFANQLRCLSLPVVLRAFCWMVNRVEQKANAGLC